MAAGKAAVLGACVILLAGPRAASANPQSDALRAKAADALYNLDRDAAIATYRQAIAADPHLGVEIGGQLDELGRGAGM